MTRACLTNHDPSQIRMRVKLPKLVGRDFAPQAALADALNSERLIAAAAREAGIATPLLETRLALYSEGVSRGDGRLDMGPQSSGPSRTVPLRGPPRTRRASTTGPGHEPSTALRRTRSRLQRGFATGS